MDCWHTNLPTNLIPSWWGGFFSSWWGRWEKSRQTKAMSYQLTIKSMGPLPPSLVKYHKDGFLVLLPRLGMIEKNILENQKKAMQQHFVLGSSMSRTIFLFGLKRYSWPQSLLTSTPSFLKPSPSPSCDYDDLYKGGWRWRRWWFCPNLIWCLRRLFPPPPSFVPR